MDYNKIFKELLTRYKQSIVQFEKTGNKDWEKVMQETEERLELVVKTMSLEISTHQWAETENYVPPTGRDGDW